MLKGCKKNVVYVKNTGSELFEEAYFIVSDTAARNGERDMLRAASEIIESSPVSGYFQNEHRENKRGRGVGKFLFFMLGAVSMAALNAIIYLIL